MSLAILGDGVAAKDKKSQEKLACGQAFNYNTLFAGCFWVRLGRAWRLPELHHCIGRPESRVATYWTGEPEDGN